MGSTLRRPASKRTASGPANHARKNGDRRIDCPQHVSIRNASNSIGQPFATVWLAMLLVVAGVLLGQANWQKLIALRAVPPD
jgi:hypothetical protein